MDNLTGCNSNQITLCKCWGAGGELLGKGFEKAKKLKKQVKRKK
jgi:hypothetical protein